ncbi:hypothetical protein [Archangium sp.]|uniref:hypothetical protein n=1 Tax=Archangium sp. TaxID=1872627 RepID=UPI002D3B62A3|nr:hypothetical protein [Archangium sp.]HYO60025.1 hypothetical protein [Archangium sp.]
MPEENLPEHAPAAGICWRASGLAWLVLRYGRTRELARKLPDWTALFAQVQAGAEGAEHLVVLIRYLLWVGDEAVHAAAGQMLHSRAF